MLRDVTSTVERDLGAERQAWIGAWSPDGRWMALRTDTPDDATRITTTVVNLDSASRTTLPADRYRGAQVCGLRDSGELLMCAGDQSSAKFQLWLVNGVTGQELRHTTVDPSPALTESERKADWAAPPGLGSGMLLPDGRTLLVKASDYLPDRGHTVPGDVLAVDIDHARATPRRYDLPPGTQGQEHRRPDGSSDYGAGEFHIGVAAAEEGLLVAHFAPGDGAAGPRGIVTELELLDLSNKRLRTVTTISESIDDILVRGQHLVE